MSECSVGMNISPRATVQHAELVRYFLAAVTSRNHLHCSVFQVAGNFSIGFGKTETSQIQFRVASSWDESDEFSQGNSTSIEILIFFFSPQEKEKGAFK